MCLKQTAPFSSAAVFLVWFVDQEYEISSDFHDLSIACESWPEIVEVNREILGIALTQKSCIFMQTNSKKCIIKILMGPRTQDTDLNNSHNLLCFLSIFCCFGKMQKNNIITIIIIIIIIIIINKVR